MKKILTDIKLNVGQEERELWKLAEKHLRAKPEYFRILKKSLDARKKDDLKYIYSIEFSAEKQAEEKRELPRIPEGKQPSAPVVIVGSGPAGLFCAVRLLEHGIRPTVIERGPAVEERERKIERFAKERVLDTEGNIQFGEGGAGTFSDGKLNTQTHGAFNREVLETFVRFGAPEEILWLNKPHIGSDNLKNVVKNMRRFIEEGGGRVLFHTKLTDIAVRDGRAAKVKFIREGREEATDVSAVVLAVGHSARDTFEMLLSRGIAMHGKDFAVGVRIEHLQSEIGIAQYGGKFSLLPAADYKLVSHASERAAFTFCMCPGGYVMPAASEEGGVVTNGMSDYARDGVNANSALVVQVTAADFGDDSPLAGVEFQRRLERAAFRAGGGSYAAPVQLVGDFLRKRESGGFGSVLPTYAAGTSFAELDTVLPAPLTSALRAAIVDMDRRLKGFACPDAVLTAVESRTSSPLRIERETDMQSPSAKGLYPCGEGAGYAGGITSSAADGLRVAEALFSKFCV